MPLFFVPMFFDNTKILYLYKESKSIIMTWLDELLEEDAITELLKHLEKSFVHEDVQYTFMGVRFREGVPICVCWNVEEGRYDYLDPYTIYGYLCM